ncbi:MAG TPA: M28 family peptidase [Jatrophihabitans sp.]|nr:M28 family peptidase [Jatrophihabitans sp.]
MPQRPHPVAADEARLRHDVELLSASPRNRVGHPDAVRAARDFVERELRQAGWSVERQPFRRTTVLGVSDAGRGNALSRLRLHRHLSGVNLVATRPGSTPPYTVVGAHLDTVIDSPGADDNASGVAAALELARRLAEPASVMIAIFDLEEAGFVGARALARRLAAERNASAMLCLESVGYYRDEPGTQQVPAGLRKLIAGQHAGSVLAQRRGDFLAVVHRRSSQPIAERFCEVAARLELPTVRVRDPRPDGGAGLLATAALPPLATLDRSDHLPFWRRGIPSVLLTGTANLRNSNYHRMTDTPDTLDYPRLARLVSALTELLA